ncbi:MAG: Dabb family protein [Paracoccaceae bacterium]
MPARSSIRHVVFFSAKNKDDIPRIMDGLSRLTGIPHAEVLEIRKNTRSDVLSGEVDIVVYGEFADESALAAYKAHPLYQASIDIVRPLREIRIAADF